MDYLKKFDRFISVRDDSENDQDKLRANHDLKPTPPKERTWRIYNYIFIWFQSSFNINGWNTGASIIKTSSLSLGEVIGAGVVSYCVSCFFVVSNARPGSDYHVGYPALIRSVYGVKLGYFMVFVRMFVATLWFSIMTYYGGMVLDVAMRCLFGHKWVNIPNILPESSGITSRYLLSFFLFWCLQFPLMFCHPKFIRHFFTFKAITLPIVTVGLFIFCMVKGGGPGNWSIGIHNTSTTSKGNQWMSVINSVFGTVSPVIINQPDIARYAKRKQDTVIPQAIGYIPSEIFVYIIGIAGTASLYRAYGVVYWNMWDLLNGILDNEWSAGARTGVWFVAFFYSLGNAGTNIFANSIPFSCDLCGLLPKYFTIVRAQIFVSFLAWAIVPWKIISNAENFITFLDSYSIFVGPLLGTMLADFYFIRKGNIHVPSLYTKNPSNPYYYFKGFNIWGFLCWACAAVIAIPGLYKVYHPNVLSQAALDIYNSGWLYTFLAGFFFYLTCGYIFKPKLYPEGHANTPKTWEYMVQYNGFFEDDKPINGVGYSDSACVGEISIENSQENSSNDENLEKGKNIVLTTVET